MKVCKTCDLGFKLKWVVYLDQLVDTQYHRFLFSIKEPADSSEPHWSNSKNGIYPQIINYKTANNCILTDSQFIVDVVSLY